MLCRTIIDEMGNMIMNIRKIFLSLFVAQLFPCIALAGGGVQINHLKASWKNPIMSYCMGSNLGNATIGRDKDICKGNYAIDANSPGQCVLGDDMGILLLVAREVNENGARFCPTTIYAEHKKKGNAWTLYSEPAQGVQGCYWLCKPGFGGEGCQGTVSGCDSVPIRRDDFNNLTMARDPQFEDAIPMFHWNENNGCGVHKSQEHDMILAVSDWLASGHGVWAAPYVIRARREGWKSKRGGIDAWPAAEATLLCKNGYTANAAGNDCEPIDETTCNLTQTCSDWPSGGFDEATMMLEFNDIRGCFQYRCREKGYAFPSTSDRTCQQCTENLRGGASPENGVCIQCDIGEIFDETASNVNYCIQADGYDKPAMQYGTNQSKQTPLNRQCWMIAEAEAYAECVKNGVPDLEALENALIRNSSLSLSGSSSYGVAAQRLQ